MKIDAGLKKLLGGIHIETHRQQAKCISLLLFLKSEESRLKPVFISQPSLFCNAGFKHRILE
jgi:hypothetical protein